MEIFILAYQKFCYKICFFIRTGSVTEHLFASLFEVQNQNEPIANKTHNTKDFINAGKSLTVLAIRCRKKQYVTQM